MQDWVCLRKSKVFTNAHTEKLNQETLDIFLICFMRFYTMVFLKMLMQFIAFLIPVNQALQQILTGGKCYSKSQPRKTSCWYQHVARQCPLLFSLIQLLVHSCPLYLSTEGFICVGSVWKWSRRYSLQQFP